MQVGCGFRVKEVKGNEYVYFWHYEDRGGGRRQIHEYVGPRRSPATPRRLSELLEAYYVRVGHELQRDLATHRQAAAMLR